MRPKFNGCGLRDTRWKPFLNHSPQLVSKSAEARCSVKQTELHDFQQTPPLPLTEWVRQALPRSIRSARLALHSARRWLLRLKFNACDARATRLKPSAKHSPRPGLWSVAARCRVNQTDPHDLHSRPRRWPLTKAKRHASTPRASLPCPPCLPLRQLDRSWHRLKASQTTLSVQIRGQRSKSRLTSCEGSTPTL